MKNSAKPFFYLLATLLLTCSFVVNPLPVETTSNSCAAIRKAPIGGAYIFFAGKYSGEITKQELAGQTKVEVEGCAKGSRIFKFTLAVTKGGKTSTLKAESNLLTDEMRKKLNSLSKGDSFEFLDTKAYWSDSKDVVNVRASKFVVV